MKKPAFIPMSLRDLKFAAPTFFQGSRRTLLDSQYSVKNGPTETYLAVASKQAVAIYKYDALEFEMVFVEHSRNMIDAKNRLKELSHAEF